MTDDLAVGQVGPNSDFDLLVIVSPGVHRRRLTMDIYRRLSDIGYPLDAVVVSSEDVERVPTIFERARLLGRAKARGSAG